MKKINQLISDGFSIGCKSKLFFAMPLSLQPISGYEYDRAITQVAHRLSARLEKNRGTYMHLDEYQAFDATGLAELIQRREVSREEVLEAAITAIEKYNPLLNAVVRTRFDPAQ